MLLPHLREGPRTWCWPRGDDTSRCRRSTRSGSSASRRPHRPDAVLDDPTPRRGVRRHPAPLARRPGLPGAGAREGGVRREAAGPPPRTLAGSWSRSMPDRQRPADGGLQPPVRAAADRPAGPLRHPRRQPSLRYLVNAGRLEPASWYLDQDTRAPASSARAATSSTPSAGGSDSPPIEVFAVPGPDAGDVVVTLRFADGSIGTITLRRRRQRALPEGDAGRHRRRPQRPARQLPARHGVGRAASRPSARPAAPDKGQRRSSNTSSRRSGPAAPMPISLDSLVATTRATIAVDRSLASGRPEPIRGTR